ncbi:ead/Ea22-like family protein [Escherichia fergusonii]|uniref:ead/Ea22-like family protein n=1 Tax=Escherichia fergusonii TaxID=564 RepID=UPI0015E527F0|nr:ead/Ea22-like family protein [Escherichia fergusonii]QLM90347.1 ead/Ea22-like family protein [Escherichia fergusonii]QMH67813.1 ead/Ea22-like family protein [Escherichia fergusonii]QML46952.1 ead/Ea22-like family protein [Escherichia fergusonii]QMS06851.1 ead/Ea22-like family protein [Escherichia fergusonii]
MSKIDYQALREAAEKAGEDKWQAKKINGDFFVIRHGSYTRQHGYTSYQPIAEIDCKPVRDFVAKANPATVLALLDERERNQQYIKSRDQENEEIALTVGKLRVELEAAKSKLNEQREYYEGVISDGSKRIAELESNEVREDGNQFLVVRHPGKTPVIKHCTGDLEEFLRKLIEQDPLVTIDIITHRYYGIGGQWVQDAVEYLHMMSDAGIRIKGE